MKRSLGILTATIAVCLVIGAGVKFFYITDKPTHKFIFPSNYSGLVEVIFEQPNAPALKQEGNYIVYEVHASGKIKTSSKNVSGPMVFYYSETNGQLSKMPTNVPMIHGLGTSSGAFGESSETAVKIPERLTFFVGTKEQWEKHIEHAVTNGTL
ncbi:DUF6843 domain-containing protein [Bacillus sp. FJAT-28004]|uniref:DUF6843 domain-containing protein n=1 Tax=Bacillus sp. FJAT-28004 TaxID=1679165 RepID=UPI0006B69BC5|nr:hypothetical protein [Bacillus sp. FJAT-28004]